MEGGGGGGNRAANLRNHFSYVYNRSSIGSQLSHSLCKRVAIRYCVTVNVIRLHTATLCIEAGRSWIVGVVYNSTNSLLTCCD